MNNSFIGKIGGDFIFEKVKYINVPRKIEDEFTPDGFDKVKEKVAEKISQALDEQYEKVLIEIYSSTEEKPISLVDVFGLLGEEFNKSKNNHNENCSNKDNISNIKKRIKYCKNPMEKKKLEQELNLLYKERKRNK